MTLKKALVLNREKLNICLNSIWRKLVTTLNRTWANRKQQPPCKKKGSMCAQYTGYAVVGQKISRIKARQIGQFLSQEYMAPTQNDNLYVYVPYCCAIRYIVLTKALNKISPTCLLNKLSSTLYDDLPQPPLL